MSESTVATPRPAATLLLLREAPAGLEVFMVVRHHAIEFMSGALVFPGGKVDPQDSALAISDLCDGLDGLDPFDAAGRIAAIREAYEEAGVLLARDNNGALVSGDRLAAYGAERARIAQGNLPFAEFLRNAGFRLAADLLAPYARWIGPKEAPKRFDTLFYVAAAPVGQLAAHDGGESVDSVWINPARAVEEGDARRRVIVFPTRCNLEWLAQYSTIEQAMAAARASQVYPIHPFVEERNGEKMLCIREDAGYPTTAMPLQKALRGF